MAFRLRWFSFSLRSMFVVTALVGSFLAGRMPAAKALRDAQIERDIARDRLARFEQQLDEAFGSMGCGIVAPKPGPISVVAVNEKTVTIAAGADDGLREDLLFDVRRDNLAVASVRVVRASPDRSLAVYCRAADAGRIAKGDFAYMR